MTTKLRLADDSDAEAWNDFVVRNAVDGYSSVYNLFEWRKVLVDTYHYVPYYLIAENEKGITGCFPLMHVKGSLFKDRLISIPFADYGCGPCVQDQNMEALTALLNKAKEIATELNGYSIEIFSPEPWISEVLCKVGYQKIYDYCAIKLDLGRSNEDIWLGLGKKVRNGIRKAEKSGVRISMEDNEETLEAIYKMHVNNMMNLGTPPHSKSFFKEMFLQLSSKGLVKNFFAEFKNEKVAAISILIYDSRVRWGTGVQLAEHRSLNPLSLLLWNAIKWANDNGYKSFDFGGSRPNSGNFSFKKKWIHKDGANGQVVNLSHLYFFLKESGKAVDIRDPTYERLSKLWKTFIPESISRIIGPWIRKQIAM